MTTVLANIEPGTYNSEQFCSFRFAPNLSFVQYSTKRIPSNIDTLYDNSSTKTVWAGISKIDLSCGMLGFDGDIARFQNKNGVTHATPDGLFMRNMINAIMSQNNTPNILFLGDVDGGTNSVKDTGNTGLNTALSAIGNSDGHTAYFKTPSDYSNSLNPTYYDLLEHSCVVLCSGNYGAGLLTDDALDAFIKYYQSGGGILLLTGGGSAISSLTGTGNGYFGTANQLARKFGAWFSGSVDRSGVSGQALPNYGHSELLLNIKTSDTITLGSGGATLQVEELTRYETKDFPVVDVAETTTIWTQTYMESGVSDTQSFEYTIDPTYVGDSWRQLLIRKNVASPFFANFSRFAWRVYNDKKWVLMKPSNTLLWIEDLKKWVRCK